MNCFKNLEAILRIELARIAAAAMMVSIIWACLGLSVPATARSQAVLPGEFVLAISNSSGLPGQNAVVDINLTNVDAVSGFNLLVSFDPTGLTLLSVTNQNSRSASFEYFSFTANEAGFAGHVRIVGIADQSGGSANQIGTGEGSIAQFVFRITSDLAMSGWSLPVRFRFMDQPLDNDNTMSDSQSGKIEQSSIQYFDGVVKINNIGPIEIGDININGVPYEIADAIYLTNNFINPVRYPLNIIQYANSDVNLDGLGATVADLVYLINIIVTGQIHKLIGRSQPSGAASVNDDLDVNKISYDCDENIGAALMVLTSSESFDGVEVINNNSQMTLAVYHEGNELRALLYSMDGSFIEAGKGDLVTIIGASDMRMESIDLSSVDGRIVTMESTVDSKILPSDFSLEQNYPNPFNPTTQIVFELRYSDRVELVIYDMMGRLINRLLNDELPAGQHTVEWDGLDDNGQRVSSGVYFYRLSNSAESTARKMVLLK